MAVTIAFHEFFLFVVRKDCLDVLAPKAGHRCYLKPPGENEIRLTNHVVTLRKGKARATGTIANNTSQRMVDLKDVLGENAFLLKPNNETAKVTSAIFQLGGDRCALQEQPIASPGDPSFDLVDWHFGAHFQHPLTNRADFTLEPGADYSLELRHRTTGSVRRWALEDGKTFIARMEDTPKATPPRKTLREFALFYDLLVDQDGHPMLGPIPHQAQPEDTQARTARLKKKQSAGGVTALCVDPLCPNAVCSAP